MIWKKNRRQSFLGVEKWNVGIRLKRVLPKFHADPSHVQGVNGHSKFQKQIENAVSSQLAVSYSNAVS